MPNSSRGSNKRDQASRIKAGSKSQDLLEKGLCTTTDIAAFFLQRISDLEHDLVSPQKANAQANCARAALKVAEVQFKYGTLSGKQNRPLSLVSPESRQEGAE